jgi:5-methylcytosine-specific restriction endonuclease McrA
MPQCKYCCGYKGTYKKKRQEAAELEAEGKKRCYSCGEAKPLEAFAPSQRHLLTAPCRECRRKKNRVTRQRRRAKKDSLPNTFTQKEWRETRQYWDGKCAYCGKKGEAQQDHFIPVDNGGGYTADNIIPACAKCNQSKGARNPFAWMEKSPKVSRGAIQDIEKYLQLVAERR